MPTFRITAPDGTAYDVTGPDGSTPEQALAQVQSAHALSKGSSPSIGGQIAQQVGNATAGLVRGAGSIGATILMPADIINDLIAGKGLSLDGNRQRRADMDAALSSFGADANSLAYKGGKLGGEIAGTAGAGGAVANALTKVAPAVTTAAPGFVNAIRTAGMSTGAAPVGIAAKAADLGVRAAGGAVTGGAAAGLVNPDEASMGAAAGGAFPVATKAAGALGDVAGMAARKMIPAASPEVAALADRAAQLGINIPADRIVNSKPLNALAATLNYVPFSGRAGTEAAMTDGLNTALSKTFGQNSSNVTQALRAASADLGSKFDTVLQANTVKMTPAFKTALADAETQANSELGPEAASIIRNQIAQIQTKGASGEIDGQAAYNIKKALDRIGGGNSDAAFYARDLKKKLMDALNDSLGPAQAADFAKVRQQYGNMLALENLAQNGAEGGVSVARLANMKNIGNPDLQELADISAQFMRSRESPHGALQRLVIGAAATGGAHGLGMLPMLPVTAGVGRGTNMLMNSDAARNYVTGRSGNALASLIDPLAQVGYRSAPVLATDR